MRDSEDAGFIDAAEFEKIERQGTQAIERWIDQQLEGTSATVVLIGAETASRPYVQYEIRRSYERRNRLLGIRLDNVKDKDGSTLWWSGSNPFDYAAAERGLIFDVAVSNKLSIPIYDWVNDAGRSNIAQWIESAPRREEGR